MALMSDIHEAESIASGLALAIHIQSAALAPHDEDRLMFEARRAVAWFDRYLQAARNSASC